MAEYTRLPGGRTFKQIDWGSEPLPPCRVHLVDRFEKPCDGSGDFDSPTPVGPWTDLCEKHAAIYSRPNTSMGYHRIRTPKEN